MNNFVKRQKIPIRLLSEITGASILTNFDLISGFWGPRRPRGGLETSKMDSPYPKTPILTPHMSLYSLWGRKRWEIGFWPIFGAHTPQKRPQDTILPQRCYRGVWDAVELTQINNFVKRQNNPTRLVSEIPGGPHFSVVFCLNGLKLVVGVI